MKYVCIQKEDWRIEFSVENWKTDRRYMIRRSHNLQTGASVSFEYETREGCLKIYNDAIASGYHRFRSAREISWYATEDKNANRYHPSNEEWTTEGIYFVPIKSHVLEEQ